MHRSAKPKPAKKHGAPNGPGKRKGARGSVKGDSRRLGAFYATGPAVPLAAPGPKKHEAAQPKEKPAAVGRRGDPWEREADSVADKVGRGEATPEVSRMPKGALRSQRKEEGAADDAQEMGIQRQEDDSQQAAEDSDSQQQDEQAGADTQKKDDDSQQADEDSDSQQAADESESQQQDEPADAGAQNKDDGAQEAAEDSDSQQAADESESQQQDEPADAGAQEKDDDAQQAAEDSDTQQAADESESQQQDEPADAGAQEKDDDAQEAADDSDSQQASDESESQQQDEPANAGAQEKDDDAQEAADDSDTQQAADESESQQQDEPADAGAQEAAEDSDTQQAADESESQQQEEDSQEASEDAESQQTSEDSESQEAEDDAQESPATGDRRQRDKGHVAARAIRERGAGEPLASATRSTLESGLGQDLSGVRVHSDGRSRDAARAMKAKAFTHKNNIWLGHGQSQSNLKLMAHETTHVMQQGGVERKPPAAGGGSARRDGPRTGAAPTAAEPGPTASSEPGAAAAIPATAGGAPPGPAATTAAIPATPAAAGATPSTPAPSAGDPAAAAAVGAGSKEESTGAAGGAGRPHPAAGAARRGGAKGAAPAAGSVEAGAGDETGAVDAAAAAAARQAADRQRMTAVKRNLGRAAKRQQGPAATRGGQRRASTGAAKGASGAAPSPDNEAKSKGEAAHTEVLGESKAGKVDQKSFLELVESKLEGMDTPKSLEDMDEFKEKGGAEELKGEVGGGVTRESDSAARDIKGAATTAPTPSEKRTATPLSPIPKAPGAAPVRATKAAPLPRAGAEVSLEPSRNKVEADLARNRLTTKRLEKANDPRFSAVQKSRKDVGEHADRAPGEFRRDEASVLAGERGELKAAERATGGSMRASHTMAQGMIRGGQGVGMVKESFDRTQVAAWINGEYATVERTVRDKLDWLSGKEGEGGEVDRLFDDGEKTARESFEKYIDDEMSAWRWKRYGGRAAIPIIGGLVAAGTWVYDKLKGIDKYPEIVQMFEDGRALYLSGLRTTIRNIAQVVDDALEFCQTEIKRGRKKIRDYVKKLPKNLTKIGKETAASVFERFDTLRDDVEAKKDELADHLAGRYKESVTKIDQRIEEMQAENRGLVDRFVSALKEVVEAIRNFRKKLKPILADAADVIEEILDDPIGFLKNLLRAVKKGFDQFKSRIGMHLKRGLLGWLFGALASTGIQIPKEFSLKAIMGLILQVLGITYDRLRAKAVKLVGPKAVAVVEKVGGYLTTLFREGPAGLWKEIKGDLADLKDMVIGQIKSWLITRIIKAAITKLVSMFNPVGAIVQAVLTIYNVVMFFIERINQILELVKTVVQSAIKVVRGQIQAAADKIEQTLGMMVPLIISFLARLLGLGGIADKVRKIIGRVRRRVDKAINKFLRKMVKKFKGLLRKGKAAVAKVFEWWKVRKKFKQGKESHSLFFEGSKSSAKLIMASDKVPLISYVKKRMADADPADKKILRQVATKAARVDNLKSQTRKGKRKAAYIGKKKGEQISRLLTAIAALLGRLKGGNTVNVRPPSKVVWKQRGGSWPEDGRLMTAKPLSIDPGGLAGSEPGEDSKLWNEVKRRKGAYVRGHLLNHHVHGPGVKKNLTPIPGGDNTRMESSYESEVKKKILNENEVISYSVVVRYGGHQARKHLPAESAMAHEIRLRAERLEPSDKAKKDPRLAREPLQWQRAKSKPKIFDDVLPLTLPADTPVSDKPPRAHRIDLNNPTDSKFAGNSHDVVKDSLKRKIPGVGEARAAQILDEAPYSSLDDLKKLKDKANRSYIDDAKVANIRGLTNDEDGKTLVHLGGGTVIRQ